MQLTSLVYLDGQDQLVLFYEPTIGFLAHKLKEVGYLPVEDENTIESNRSFRGKMREMHQRNAA